MLAGLLTITCGLALAAAPSKLAPAPSKLEPPVATWRATKEAVHDHFAGQPDWRPGDLITKSDVRAALAAVGKAGWRVPDAGDWEAAALDDEGLLARELDTTAGRRFMRKVATVPQGFDRLDRLAGLPDGAKLLKQLIRNPGGEDLIEYLAVEPQGRQLGRMLAQGKGQAKFNQATGRIYTAEQLVERLRSAWKQAHPAEPSQPRQTTGGGRSR